MNVFISWSGDKSNLTSKVLKTWLSHLFPFIKLSVSTDHIESGSKWTMSLPSSLDNTDIGIICITKENINSPWLLFEAGAMFKTLNENQLIPLLVDVENKALPGPLSYFRTLTVQKKDIYALVKILSKHSSLKYKSEKHLETVFDNWYPLLEEQLTEINKTKSLPKNKDSVKILTAKELKILELLVQGKNKYEIVSETQIPMQSYHSTIRILCIKLEAKSKTELIELVKYYELI